MCKECDFAEKLLGYRDICPKSGKIELTHKMLVSIGTKFLMNFGCSVVLPELSSLNNSGEIPDIFAMKSGYSVVVECKISRADFAKDRKKIFRQNPEMGMGQYRYILCPEDVIKPVDLAGVHENWGLLYVKQNRRIKKVIFPKGNYFSYDEYRFPCNLDAERSLLASALRRKQKMTGGM